MPLSFQGPGPCDLHRRQTGLGTEEQLDALGRTAGLGNHNGQATNVTRTEASPTPRLPLEAWGAELHSAWVWGSYHS